MLMHYQEHQQRPQTAADNNIEQEIIAHVHTHRHNQHASNQSETDRDQATNSQG